jgi:hypothetical protein
MNLYDKNGNLRDFSSMESIYCGSRSEIFKSDDEFLKIFFYGLNERQEEVFKLLMSLDLNNFYKIFDLYYGDNNKLMAISGKFYDEDNNFDILTNETLYTLNNLYNIFMSAVRLTENNIWMIDLHSNNVILNKDGMTVIDTELYTISDFISYNDLVTRNIRAVCFLFEQLYLDALKKYHSDINTPINRELIKDLFGGNTGEKLDNSCMKLERVKYPIDYLKR